MRIAEKIRMGRARRISRLNATDVVELLAKVGAFNVAPRTGNGRVRKGKTRKDHASGSWASRFARRAVDPYRNGSGDYKKIV